ncbi:polyphenol oxidase family protein [Brucepastera parasyntrophica]|uniref:polyphenol oxidase family protein n=1 Tax=Brucepastera parasyntrophica TaxID=2880008 RepID=UPI00210B62AE|nr:polyphenol oxidase family protein [Brucepastera parasyntrophica]ULQ60500.1 polyphenol oxidase family protein [Brucepastera parasyntrophica]
MIRFQFGRDDPENEKVSFPECGLSPASEGSMKPLMHEQNRLDFFSGQRISYETVISPVQSHSQTVYFAEHSASGVSRNPEADGIITGNATLVPCITVADCVPIYLFDPVSLCFGVLHSGWKGTGIIRSAVELAAEKMNSRAENFYVLLGPHIRSCCYTVDPERADYFSRAFGPSCISPVPGNDQVYRLSLAEANRNLCLSLGILSVRITDTGLCTSCDTRFGSYRRQGKLSFTPMAAFIRRQEDS